MGNVRNVLNNNTEVKISTIYRTVEIKELKINPKTFAVSQNNYGSFSKMNIKK